MRETYISVDGVMCYEVMPVNVSGIVINKYLREKFVRKYKGILPKDVYDKVTKKRLNSIILFSKLHQDAITIAFIVITSGVIENIVENTFR